MEGSADDAKLSASEDSATDASSVTPSPTQPAALARARSANRLHRRTARHADRPSARWSGASHAATSPTDETTVGNEANDGDEEQLAHVVLQL